MANTYNNTDIDNDKPLFSIEDENLYSIEDDEGPVTDKTDLTDTEDDSPYAYGYVLDDEPEEEASPEDVKVSKNLFLLLAKIMSTPVEGWKSFRRLKLKPEAVASGCFYPLAALAAVSKFAGMYYDSSQDVHASVLGAFGIFISFFFGYFTSLLGARLLLPVVVKENLPKEVARGYIMINMSTLAIFMTLYNCLPMLEPIVVFMPLWTIYLIFKGVKILRVPKEKTAVTECILTLCIIGAPLLWNSILGFFL